MRYVDYVTPAQLRAAQKSSVEGAIALTVVQLAALEKITALNANVFKGSLEDSMAYARAMLGANDAHHLWSLQAAYVQPGLERATSYCKALHEIAGETNAQLSKAGERSVAEWMAHVISPLERISKNGAAGSDFVLAAAKGFSAAASAMFGNFNRVTKQASMGKQRKAEGTGAKTRR